MTKEDHNILCDNCIQFCMEFIGRVPTSLICTCPRNIIKEEEVQQQLTFHESEP